MNHHKPRPKKQFSQNFFGDPELLAEGLDQLQLQAEDLVIEIGPGQGILTRLLLARVAAVTAFEIDPELIPLLEREFATESRLKLIQGDFMQFDLSAFYPEAPLSRRKLIANIPYHLTSPILLKILNQPALQKGQPQPWFSDICLMVQREVADKLLAAPGTSDYGALSVWVRYAASVERLLDLPRELFFPVPRVDSSLIRLSPHIEPPVALANPALFWRLLERCYQLRRKTLRNVLKSLGYEASRLETINRDLDLGRRGETLSLDELADLANQLWQAN